MTAGVDPASVAVGDVIAWRTWSGDIARAEVWHIERLTSGEPLRIRAGERMYWEATCAFSLAEALRGCWLEPAAA